MKTYWLIVSLLVLPIFSAEINAQNRLVITDMKTGKITAISPGAFSFVKCFYQLNETQRVFFSGYVDRVLDSAIVLKNRGVIPLSAISHVDNVTVKRLILPGIVTGVAVFGIGRWINPTDDATTEALIGIGCIGLTSAYVLRFDRRRLKRNKVGERVRLEIRPAR